MSRLDTVRSFQNVLPFLFEKTIRGNVDGGQSPKPMSTILQDSGEACSTSLGTTVRVATERPAPEVYSQVLEAMS